MGGFAASRGVTRAVLGVAVSAILMPLLVFGIGDGTTVVRLAQIAPTVSAAIGVWSAGSDVFILERTAARKVKMPALLTVGGMTAYALVAVGLGAWLGPEDGLDTARAVANTALLLGVGLAVCRWKGSIAGALLAGSVGLAIFAVVPEMSPRAVARVVGDLETDAYLWLGGAIFLAGHLILGLSPVIPKTAAPPPGT